MPTVVRLELNNISAARKSSKGCTKRARTARIPQLSQKVNVLSNWYCFNPSSRIIQCGVESHGGFHCVYSYEVSEEGIVDLMINDVIEIANVSMKENRSRYIRDR